MNPLLSKLRRAAVGWTPPRLADLARDARRTWQRRQRPEWTPISHGPLAGCELKVVRRGRFLEMIRGDADAFFYDYLAEDALAGCVIYDIGAFVGYHTHGFARLVGAGGHVVAFEPSAINRERLSAHLERNRARLPAEVTLCPFAVGAEEGTAVFRESPTLDDFTSSGNHLGGVPVPLPERVYRDAGFVETRVPVRRLDDLVARGAIPGAPAAMKIDVEGAEGLVLAGARELIAAHHPVLLIEVHSVEAMKEVAEALLPLGYQLEVLERAGASRAFVGARHGG